MGCKNTGEKKRKKNNEQQETVVEEVVIREHIKKGGDGKVTQRREVETKKNDNKDNEEIIEMRKEYKINKNPHNHNGKHKGNHNDNSSSFDLNRFRQEALQAHNEYRRMHKVPPLKLNDELNNIAQKYANYLAKTEKFQHSENTWNGENLGENLFNCYDSTGKPPTGKTMTKSWYDEIKDYDFNKAQFTGGTGHFTQVVWKDSQQVGFGVGAKGNNYFCVGNYYPAGNVLERFNENVLKN